MRIKKLEKMLKGKMWEYLDIWRIPRFDISDNRKNVKMLKWTIRYYIKEWVIDQEKWRVKRIHNRSSNYLLN